MGNTGHLISHGALTGTGRRRPSLGKCLWAFVHPLGDPVFSHGLAGMMNPGRGGYTKKLQATVFLNCIRPSHALSRFNI